ncbi:putative RNA-binding protein Luc7-like 1 [Chytridiales sp. JEL 0842]|nr:putative RNA-binding protein Luc7-like 1 [Chytridiales sp. JEL 0842]
MTSGDPSRSWINESAGTTYVDVGECPKIHSANLREKYKEAVARRELNYEKEWARKLERFMRSQKEKWRRLERWLDFPLHQEKVYNVVLSIEEYMQRIDVEMEAVENELSGGNQLLSAKDHLRKAEDLNDRRRLAMTELQKLSRHYTGAYSLVTICEDCGAALSIFDEEESLRIHKSGNLHKGFLIVKSTLDKLGN